MNKVIIIGCFLAVLNIIELSECIAWKTVIWSNNCNFIGRDYNKVYVAEAECGLRCEREEECTHFTWTKYKNGTCYMKNGEVRLENAFKVETYSFCGVISTTKITTKNALFDENQFNASSISNNNGTFNEAKEIKWIADSISTWAHNCDFQGKDFNKYYVPKTKCSEECKNHPKCSHFTWTNYRNGTCWMKEGKILKNKALSVNMDTVCGIVF
jgi:hypothetical protein